MDGWMDGWMDVRVLLAQKHGALKLIAEGKAREDRLKGMRCVLI
jgi:hypothetical protein